MKKIRNKKLSSAVFGGGCFWCTEAVFKMLKGVSTVMPGYAGGTTLNPTYEDVCTKNTGHAEVIRVAYDPAVIRYEDLLTAFFASHDATTKNRQGNDVGPQYRSIILYADEEQKNAAEAYIARLQAAAPQSAPIVTEVVPLTVFYEAEASHRDYYARNPDNAYCQFVIEPKVLKAKEQLKKLLA